MLHRTHDLVQVDVFTQTPLAGNPLAIFADAHGLNDAEMQATGAESGDILAPKREATSSPRRELKIPLPRSRRRPSWRSNLLTENCEKRNLKRKLQNYDSFKNGNHRNTSRGRGYDADASHIRLSRRGRRRKCLLSRSWCSERTCCAIAARISDVFFSIPGVDSAPSAPLSSGRS